MKYIILLESVFEFLDQEIIFHQTYDNNILLKEIQQWKHTHKK